MKEIGNYILKTEVPYPEIVGAIYSPETIRLLKNLYASRGGEFTAIATYFYQHIVLAPFNEEISKLFEQISMVEMMHLELLGEAIVSFGGDPTFSSPQGGCWNCRFVDYDKNVKKMLLSNIKSETAAIADYMSAASKVANKSLSDLLVRIAEDEMLHKKALEMALYNLIDM